LSTGEPLMGHVMFLLAPMVPVVVRPWLYDEPIGCHLLQGNGNEIVCVRSCGMLEIWSFASVWQYHATIAKWATCNPITSFLASSPDQRGDLGEIFRRRMEAINLLRIGPVDFHLEQGLVLGPRGSVHLDFRHLSLGVQHFDDMNVLICHSLNQCDIRRQSYHLSFDRARHVTYVTSLCRSLPTVCELICDLLGDQSEWLWTDSQ